MSKPLLVLLTAVISAALTSLVWLIGLYAAYTYASTPAPFAVKTEAPGVVTLGEDFQLRVHVTNQHDTRVTLGSIDIYDSLADGFTWGEIDPAPSEGSPLFDFTSYYFHQPLDPGETVTVTFHLTATIPGLWTGDVDCCTPAETFVSASTSIRVQEAGLEKLER